MKLRLFLLLLIAVIVASGALQYKRLQNQNEMRDSELQAINATMHHYSQQLKIAQEIDPSFTLPHRPEYLAIANDVSHIKYPVLKSIHEKIKTYLESDFSKAIEVSPVGTEIKFNLENPAKAKESVLDLNELVDEYNVCVDEIVAIDKSIELEHVQFRKTVLSYTASQHYYDTFRESFVQSLNPLISQSAFAEEIKTRLDELDLKHISIF